MKQQEMNRIDTTELENTAPNGQEDASLEKIREILFGQQQKERAEQLSRLSSRLTEESQSVRAELVRRIEALERAQKSQIDSLRVQIEANASSQLQLTDSLTSALRDAEGRWDVRAQSLGADFKQALESLKDELSRSLGQLEDSLRLASGHLRVDFEQSVLQLSNHLRSLLAAQKSETDRALTALGDELRESHQQLAARSAESLKGLHTDLIAQVAEQQSALERAENGLRKAKVDRSSLAELFTHLASRLSSEGGGSDMARVNP